MKGKVSVYPIFYYCPQHKKKNVIGLLQRDLKINARFTTVIIYILLFTITYNVIFLFSSYLNIYFYSRALLT